VDHGRPAVAATEVELAEAGYSNASSFLDIRRPPGVDLRAGPVVNVAAEVSSGVVARRHAGHISARKRTPHRPTGGQCALPGRTGAGSRARVTVERGVFLADVCERTPTERPPERRQLRSDREAGDSRGRLRDPDKTAHRDVAEDGPSYRQAAYDAARELPDRYARDGRC